MLLVYLLLNILFQALVSYLLCKHKQTTKLEYGYVLNSNLTIMYSFMLLHLMIIGFLLYYGYLATVLDPTDNAVYV